MKRFLLLFVFIFSCLCSSAQSALYPAFRIKQECATVFFYDSSYAVGAPIVKRKWYFGDGTSDTALNPVHVYRSRAMYNVTLVVENSEGKRDSSILYDLYVNTPFNAEITLSKDLYDSLRIDYFFDRYTCTWYLNDEPFPSGNYMWECFPSENGVYKVIVKSHDGCIDTSAPFIYNRKDSIFADIYHYISNTCKPSEITFHGEYSGSEWLSKVDSVRWDFGDGQSSTRERFDYFTHNYATPGTYVVKLTPFVSSGYTRVFTRTIVVSKWSTKIVPDSIAVAGTRTLSAISNPEISSVIWSTGAKTNSISIQQSGVYSVWGKDACGAIRAADTLYVDVASVKVSIGAIQPCQDSAKIKAVVKTTTLGKYTLLWNTGQTGDSIIVRNAGKYSVSLLDSVGKLKAVDTVNVSVQGYVWDVSVNVDSLSAPGSYKLTAITSLDYNGARFNWSTGQTSKSITVDTAGRYYVSVSDSCGNVRANDTVYISKAPVKPFSALLELHTSPDRNNDTLFALPYNNTATYQYSWYRNDSLLETSSYNMLHSPVNGAYYVIIGNTAGYYDTSAVLFYEKPVDTIHLETGSVTGNDSLAIKAAFNRDFNTDNIFNIQLSFNNSGSRGLQPGEVISLGTVNGTDRNTSLKVAIPDTLACAVNYVLRIVASSPADTTEWSQPFSIINQPQQPVIIQRGDSLFTTSPYNLQWYKNGQLIEGATNPYYRARVNASYTVEAQNGTECSSMSDARSVVITAVGDVTLGENTVKAYPNPSSGTVYLQFGKPLLKTATINVYDLKGKLHYTRTTRQQQQPLDLSGLPQGYYLIEVNGYGTRKVLPIILQ